jgi:hypothetical protein
MEEKGDIDSHKLSPDLRPVGGAPIRVRARWRRFTPGGFIHTRCGAEILPGAVALEELPCLVCLGAYLAILHRRDSTGAPGAAAAGG